MTVEDFIRPLGLVVQENSFRNVSQGRLFSCSIGPDTTGVELSDGRIIGSPIAIAISPRAAREDLARMIQGRKLVFCAWNRKYQKRQREEIEVPSWVV